MPRYVDLDADIKVETSFGAKKSEAGKSAQRTKREHELLRLAGVDPESKDIQVSFFQIAIALGRIHNAKGILYGDYLETHGSEPELFCLTQHFCDIKRKFVRAENYIRLRNDGVKIPLDDLIDTYSDLAVYAIMGLDLIFHLKERDDEQVSEDGGTAGAS